jgi:hypothetical protein
VNLSLSTSDIVEVEAARHDMLAEQQTIKRLRKGVYPRSQFSYSNYNVDPRPDILKLGAWRHPKTKNVLLGGVNLNYLSSGQIKRLKKIARRIFSHRTLRDRYGHLKRRLPDIAHYYRTYDEDYISNEQPDEFKDYSYRDIKEPTTRDLQAKKQADAEKLVTIEPEEPEEQDDAIDKGRERWQLQRRLYDPETGRRTKPERAKGRGSKWARREKFNRYRAQRRKLKQMTRDAELERIADKLRDEPADVVEPQSALGAYEAPGEYFYSPTLGFVWATPTAYIKHHGAETFGLLREHRKGSVLAVHDIRSGVTLFDAVIDHIFMLQDAGWDYHHTILMEVDDGELVLRSEAPKSVMMEAASKLDYSKIVKVLSE